jgi:hypothetical protein
MLIANAENIKVIGKRIAINGNIPPRRFLTDFLTMAFVTHTTS